MKKNQYFIHEGEPTGFFAGVIKGKVSVRKTHIFDRKTNQIVIKPLYKIILMKKPSFGRGSQKIPENSYNFNKPQDNNENSPKENNNTKDDNKSKENQELPKNNSNSKKGLHRMKSTQFNLKNNEEKTNKGFKIIKEIFDPEKYIVSEEELFRQGEGYCFGEWALIYREPRAASIYTLEDCTFFTLNEVHFRNSFLKSLNNSEYNKKKFALQNFLPFNMMDERQLSIYKNIIPITCKRNQIIFNEGDISDSIYLIYLGSFTLEKKYGIKKYRVLDLERGSIVGLESIFEGENSKYKCTLKLSPGLDVGLIFKLKINRLRPYIVNQMKISFKTNYNVFIKSWNYLFFNNVFVHQKISNEKNLEEQKKEFGKFFEENKELMELNSNLVNRKWNSVLNIASEDKFEVLFKTCLQKKTYNNYKKDGSLRIFSSKQRNKIKTNDDKKSSNSKYINLIKYFQNIKSDINENNSKISNSFLNNNNLNLNINNISENNRSLNTLRSLKNKINLTEIRTNVILTEDEEDSATKIFFNEQKLQSTDKKTIKRKNKNNIIKSNLKLNKNLLYETNLLKENNNNESKDSDENKYKTIHFKNNSVINENNNFKKRDMGLLKKISQNNRGIDNIRYNLNNKMKNQNKLNINANKNVNYNKGKIFSENMNFSNDKKINSRNKSLFITKNSSFEKFNMSNNSKINSPISIHNNKKNSTIFQKFNSLNSTKNKTNNLFNEQCFSERQSKIKDFENTKINSLSNRNYSTKEKRDLSPMNIRTNISFKIFNQSNIKSPKIKIKNELNNNNLFELLKNKNIIHRNKKIKKFFDVENDKNIYHELILSTGFPVTYFKKINPIDNINFAPLNTKNKPFPSPTNYFKVSFHSGIFEIPLISDSLKSNKNIGNQL